MSKELEALKDLRIVFVSHCKTLGCEENYIKVCDKKISDIEKELKALEIIKNKYTIIPSADYEMYAFYITESTSSEETEILKEALTDE